MVEVTAVETLKSLLAAGDRIELDVDVAFTVRVYCNVNNLAIFLVTLGLDVDLKFFDPVDTNVAQFPIAVLVALAHEEKRGTYSSGSKAFSILMHFEAMGLSTTGVLGLLMTAWGPCFAGSGLSRRARASISLLRS